MKSLVCLLALALSAIGLSAQGFGICCVEVGETTSTTITFSQPPATGFSHYDIMTFDNTLQDYQSVATITDITQTTYSFPLAEAATQSVRCRVRAVYSSGNNLQDDISTIFLGFEQNQEGIIRLVWTPLGEQMPQGSETKPYKIYRKRHSDLAEWSYVASTEATTHTDSLPPICSDTIYYKIEVENDNGCVSRSNQIKLAVTDTRPPEAPTLNSNSIDIDLQQLTLNWTPSNSEDVYGYIVCSGSPCVAIDTIWGADASTYQCDECSVEELNSLAVMAFDTCFNTSLRTNTHTNMVLNAKRNDCSDKVKLSWNAYTDFDSGTEKYDIYYREGESGNYNLVLSTQNTEETITIDASKPLHAFYIEAVSNNGTIARSNLRTLSVDAETQVDFIEIRRVSVRENNTDVELELYVDASIVVPFYELRRSENGGSYTLIANIPYSGNNTLTYTDNLPQSAAESSFSYIFAAPDRCGLVYKTSLAVSPMQLSVKSIDPGSNLLTWTPYNGWQSGVGQYQIFRYSQSEPVVLLSSFVTSNSYTDYSADVLSLSDRTYYFVQAVEATEGADGKAQTANSTCDYVKHETLIYIPNAFMPKEPENNIFKPVCHFIAQGSYSMRVYNRMGELLFVSDEPKKGWDGRYKGEFCPLGTYVYHIEYVNSRGEREIRQGTVAIVQ